MYSVDLDDEQLHCVCKSRDEGKRPFIQCDRCSNWYHPKCIKMSKREYLFYQKNQEARWYCSSCPPGSVYCNHCCKIFEYDYTNVCGFWSGEAQLIFCDGCIDQFNQIIADHTGLKKRKDGRDMDWQIGPDQKRFNKLFDKTVTKMMKKQAKKLSFVKQK